MEADTGRGDAWLTAAFSKLRYTMNRFCRLHRIEHISISKPVEESEHNIVEPPAVLNYLLSMAKVLYPSLKENGKLRGSHLRHTVHEWIWYAYPRPPISLDDIHKPPRTEGI